MVNGSCIIVKYACIKNKHTITNQCPKSKSENFETPELGLTHELPTWKLGHVLQCIPYPEALEWKVFTL